MKTTKEHFKLFKSECRGWADRLELNNWRFDFILTEIGNRQAGVLRNYITCVIAVQFNTEIVKSKDEGYRKLIKDTAKHEMIHVLLGNFALLGQSRYITEDELDKAEEELVVKLEGIL